MDEFKRYGIYVVPDGAFFARASAWLGWDAVAGHDVPQPDISLDANALTATPRKYGFHGTIKPPFALADGCRASGLAAALEAFCATQAPVVVPALEVRRLGDFVAIVPAAPPSAPPSALADLAGQAVSALDSFRAPASDTELARRRQAGLSPRQEALLQRWGYPYVMEEFRFHMTLTGRTPDADTVRDALAAHFAPVLPQPYTIDTLALMGEAASGKFHLIHRYTLSG